MTYRHTIVLCALLSVSLTEAQAQFGDVPIKTFGYFQTSFQHRTSFPDEPPQNAFSLQQLNLFFQTDISRRWSAFVNFEALNNFSSSRRWGSFNVEEAWLRFRTTPQFNLKAGLQIPIFNNLNEIKNRTPLLPYIIRPLVYETSFSEFIAVEDFTPTRAFVQAYGFVPAGLAKIDYAAYLGNSPNIRSQFDNALDRGDGQTGIDTTTSILVGGRLGLRLGNLKAGVSATHDQTHEFQGLEGLFGGTASRFKGIARTRLGADLSYQLGPMSFDGEAIQVLYDEDEPELNVDKTFFYGTLGYQVNDRMIVYVTYGETLQRQVSFNVEIPDGETIPFFPVEIDIQSIQAGIAFNPHDRISLKAQVGPVDVVQRATVIPFGDVTRIKWDFTIYSVAASVLFYMALRDLKIGAKQGIGFGLILVVMAAVSVFAIDQMGVLRREIDDINDVWLQRALLISRVNLNASALRTTQLQHAFASRAAQKQAYVDTMLVLIDKVNEDGEAYLQLIEEAEQRNLMSDNQNRLAAGLDSLWDMYLNHSLNYLDLRDQDAIALLSGEAGDVFSLFSTDLAELVRLNEASAADAAQRAEVTYETTRNRIIALLMVTILLSMIIATRLVGFITVPVRGLVNAARKVADGNFNVHVESVSKDEIGTLAHSFNWMTQSLKEQQEDLRTANGELQDQKNELEETLHQLEDAQEQLVLKEKMASLGQLTAGIAHEIKNPLNFVNNFAVLSIELSEELAEELEANKEAPVSEVLGTIEDLINDLQFNARKIHEHGRRADSIVHGMLEHSRGTTGERRTININSFVDEYVNLAYHGVRARQTEFNATINRDFDEAAGDIKVVPQDIGRVLLNLFNNAFYAVYEKKKAEGRDYDPCVSIRTRAHDKHVEIRVQDNGPGIPEAIHARIFEPFFTTKPTGTGNTGLGLSLSYEIITQGHGGTLTVESEEGQGATFIITLPL